MASDGQRLGDKKLTERQIIELTGIAAQALLMSCYHGRLDVRKNEKKIRFTFHKAYIISFYQCFTAKGKDKPFSGFERELPMLPLTIEQEVLKKVGPQIF
jgi:hypothetical protein